jgi:hypothetical protein
VYRIGGIARRVLPDVLSTNAITQEEEQGKKQRNRKKGENKRKGNRKGKRNKGTKRG